MIDGNPLYIFVHIPKTAGTTFIKNITKNLKPEEKLELNPETLGISDKINKARIVKAFEKLARKKKLDKIRFIYGHAIPYGIHKYFEREARYITFARNPARRIASQYNYLTGQYRHGLDRKLQKRFKDIYFVKGGAKNFMGWYKQKFLVEDADLTLLNTFQFLNKLGYVSKESKTESDLIKDLKKFYFIGITKNFANDSLFLYKQFDIKKFFFSENVSEKTVDITKRAGLRKQIEKDHPKSKSLFLAAQKLHQKFITKHPEYWDIVRKERIVRLTRMPFTHLLYDPRSLARRIRSKIQ